LRPDRPVSGSPSRNWLMGRGQAANSSQHRIPPGRGRRCAGSALIDGLSMYTHSCRYMESSP
jgi:hypothetical protein